MTSEPANGIGSYDPRTWKLRTFHDHRQNFLEGRDTPRDYLERCLEIIERLETEVKAWAYLNTDAARKAADESTERYKAGKPLSLVDGMPIGIKDLIETADMPTEYNSDLFRGNQPIGMPRRSTFYERAVRLSLEKPSRSLLVGEILQKQEILSTSGGHQAALRQAPALGWDQP